MRASPQLAIAQIILSTYVFHVRRHRTSVSKATLYKSTHSSVIRWRYYCTPSHRMIVPEQPVKERLLSMVYTFHSYRMRAFKWIDHQMILHLPYPCTFCHQSEVLKNSQATSKSVYVNQPSSGLLPATSARFLVLEWKRQTTFEVIKQPPTLSTMPNTYDLWGVQSTIYEVSSYLQSTRFQSLNETTTTNTNLSSDKGFLCIHHKADLILLSISLSVVEQ